MILKIFYVTVEQLTFRNEQNSQFNQRCLWTKTNDIQSGLAWGAVASPCLSPAQSPGRRFIFSTWPVTMGFMPLLPLSLLPQQFQSFSQYRCKTAKKSEEEIDFLRSNPKIWNVHSVLNVLHSLVDKSNINRQLEVYTSGGECCLPSVLSDQSPQEAQRGHWDSPRSWAVVCLCFWVWTVAERWAWLLSVAVVGWQTDWSGTSEMRLCKHSTVSPGPLFRWSAFLTFWCHDCFTLLKDWESQSLYKNFFFNEKSGIFANLSSVWLLEEWILISASAFNLLAVRCVIWRL